MFSIIGAAAFMSGVKQNPLFAIIVVSELLNELNMLPAIAIGVFVSNTVSTLIGSSLTRRLINLRIPLYLDSEPPLSFGSKSIGDICKRQVFKLNVKVTSRDLQDFLDANDKNIFPVVDSNDRLLGSITRLRLQRVLSIGQEPNNLDQEKIFARIESTEEIIKSSEPTELRMNEISLENYLDQSPISMVETFSLVKAYKIFRREGLRHLFVVDLDNKMVGIVTRKDLLL